MKLQKETPRAINSIHVMCHRVLGNKTCQKALYLVQIITSQIQPVISHKAKDLKGSKELEKIMTTCRPFHSLQNPLLVAHARPVHQKTFELRLLLAVGLLQSWRMHNRLPW